MQSSQSVNIAIDAIVKPFKGVLLGQAVDKKEVQTSVEAVP